VCQPVKICATYIGFDADRPAQIDLAGGILQPALHCWPALLLIFMSCSKPDIAHYNVAVIYCHVLFQTKNVVDHVQKCSCHPDTDAYAVAALQTLDYTCNHVQKLHMLADLPCVPPLARKQSCCMVAIVNHSVRQTHKVG